MSKCILHGSRLNDSNFLDGPLQRPSLVPVTVDTRKPLLFGTREEVIKAGGTQAPRSGEKVDRNESFLGVPIMTGDKVIGGINVQSYKQNAFNQNDLRLLQTLANAMSVALQNAQSFKAEQERVAELQIINSIQQELAAELDFQAIVDLVGDKLREVFNTGDFGIRWYDEKNNLVHFLYEYEHGERLDIPPQPPNPGGTFDLFLKDRQPIVANTPELAARTGGILIDGTDMSKSIIAIPIITSDRLTGSLQIENYERENAFGESELRLLTTIAASLGTALENARCSTWPSNVMLSSPLSMPYKGRLQQSWILKGSMKRSAKNCVRYSMLRPYPFILPI